MTSGFSAFVKLILGFMSVKENKESADKKIEYPDKFRRRKDKDVSAHLPSL